MTLPHLPQQQTAHPECRLQAAIFDMDGVIAQTASIHAAAWKVTFDEILRRHAPPGADVRLSDDPADYYAYVDGKPRIEGMRTFVRARHRAFRAGRRADRRAQGPALHPDRA